MQFKHAFALSLIVLSAACGEIETRPINQNPNPIVRPNHEAVYMFAADFGPSAGQLLTADFDAVANMQALNVASAQLGSSAVLRIFDGLIYVLHDGFSIGSLDNVQILDPDNGFSTVNQFSTGNGTNPHDIAVIGQKAYITLYDPSNDSTNVDVSGNPGDLIVMDLTDGSIDARLSFAPYLANDGSLLARADCITRVGDLLYVCVQDMDVQGFNFVQNAPGKIVAINTATDSIESVITLKGRNPVDIVYSESEDKLFVALQAPFNLWSGGLDSEPYGGIEIVERSNPQSSVLINDEDLGGYIERVVTDGEAVVIVASQMDPVAFFFTSSLLKMPVTGNQASETSLFLGNSSDVRELAVDSRGRLWVSRRVIASGAGTTSDPQVEVLDVETGNAVGTAMVPPVSVISIAFD